LVSPIAQREFYINLPHHHFHVIENASHMSLIERPQQVNQSITEFLKEQQNMLTERKTV
jgi:pimeloyl-ACP methyl ester carboxylesterase